MEIWASTTQPPVVYKVLLVSNHGVCFDSIDSIFSLQSFQCLVNGHGSWMIQRRLIC